MIFLFWFFVILASLSIYGEFRWGINYSPFYFKQSSIYFLFQFLLCSTLALGFYIAAKEEKKDMKITKDKFKDTLIIIFLFLLPFIFFYKIIFLKKVFFGGDITFQNYPQRVWVAKNLKEGIFPLWCPEVSHGYPLFAEGQTGMLFPLNIIYLYLPGWLSYNLSIILNFILVSIFMYFLMKLLNIHQIASLFSAIIFSYLGWFFDIEHINTLQVSIWLPIIFYFIVLGEKENKLIYFIFSGLFFGIQFLGGYPQVSFFTVISLLCYFLFKIIFKIKDIPDIMRFTGKFILIALFGFLIASVQLIPQFELIKYSARIKVSYEEFTFMSILPQNMIKALLFFKIENINYLNIISFPLIFIGLFFRKNAYYLGIFTIIILLLSMGKYLPGYKIFYYIPVFNWFKYPDKITFLVFFAIAILSGFGLNEVLNKKVKLNKFVKFFATFYLLFAICFTYYLYQSDIFLESYIEFFFSEVGIQIIILAVLITVYYLYIVGKLNKKYFFVILLFSIISSLYGNHKGYWKSIKEYSYSELNFLKILSKEVPPGDYFFGLTDTPLVYGYKPEYIKFLKNYDKGIYRVTSNHYEGYILPNLNLNYNISFPGVYYGPLPLKKAVEYASLMRLNLLNLSNVKYIVSDKLYNVPELEIIYNKEVKIYKNKTCLPRAFIVRKYEVADENEILDLMKLDIFNPQKEVFLEEEPDFDAVNFDNTPKMDKVKIVKYTPNEIDIDAKLENPGILVLSDTYYPGWRCFVNGKEKKIYKADYIFRAIHLEEGKHNINFIYDPLSFKIGLYLGIISLLLIIILIMYRLKDER
jgi:hypothetical protein